MESLWLLWLATAALGGVMGVLRRPARTAWAFDALLLFLLASLVCDAIALLAASESWRLNPYAISAGFAAAAGLRAALSRRRPQLSAG